MVLIGPFLLKLFLLLHFMQVMTRGAAGYSAEHSVMAGIMAGDAARYRA
jgi:hypothetical protein